LKVVNYAVRKGREVAGPCAGSTLLRVNVVMLPFIDSAGFSINKSSADAFRLAGTTVPPFWPGGSVTHIPEGRRKLHCYLGWAVAERRLLGFSMTDGMAKPQQSSLLVNAAR